MLQSKVEKRSMQAEKRGKRTSRDSSVPSGRRKRRKVVSRSRRRCEEVISLLPWVKVTCIPTKGVPKTQLREKLEVEVLDDNFKVIQASNVVFFVPHSVQDFARILEEKVVKIGGKSYQASAIRPEADPFFKKD